MTPSDLPVPTGLLRAADLSLEELLARREAGDTALDLCLRRVVESVASGKRESVAAFNAAPLRRS
jgi:FXSXX-COOH protein